MPACPPLSTNACILEAQPRPSSPDLEGLPQSNTLAVYLRLSFSPSISNDLQPLMPHRISATTSSASCWHESHLRRTLFPHSFEMVVGKIGEIAYLGSLALPPACADCSATAVVAILPRIAVFDCVALLGHSFPAILLLVSYGMSLTPSRGTVGVHRMTALLASIANNDHRSYCRNCYGHFSLSRSYFALTIIQLYYVEERIESISGYD